jgi:hypothetical protein
MGRDTAVGVEPDRDRGVARAALMNLGRDHLGVRGWIGEPSGLVSTGPVPTEPDDQEPLLNLAVLVRPKPGDRLIVQRD